MHSGVLVGADKLQTVCIYALELYGGHAENFQPSYVPRQRTAGCSEECRWYVGQESHAVPTDLGLTALLARAIEDLGMPAHRLPSGAGHDAAQVAKITPIAMLFVRCERGISHNPAKAVKQGDVAAAIEVTSRFLKLVAESKSSESAWPPVT